jgi:hypothetical protein
MKQIVNKRSNRKGLSDDKAIHQGHIKEYIGIK